MQIVENEKVKQVKSENYNYIFNKENGFFVRWGKTKEDDPQMAPMPEILDLEISQGKCSGKCPECYKCNGDVDYVDNMSFDTFRRIFHRVANTVIEVKSKDNKDKPAITSYNEMVKDFEKASTKNEIIKDITEFFTDILKPLEYCKVYNKGLLTQIAFGICDLDTNPDFVRMMKYCREFDVVPNFTFNGNGLTEELADEIAKVAGACAISVRNENAYNSVKMLTDRGMTQVNFHLIAHQQSFNKIKQVIDDVKTDSRLEKLNAIVLLRYKPKGNGIGKFQQLTVEQYKELIYYAREKGVNIGFDSCSAPLYLKAIKGDKELEKTEIFVEPCESSLFSSYINWKGEFFACSFCEGEGMWKEGINVLDYDTFEEVWNHEKTQKFREMLLNNCRNCPMFRLEK